MRNDDFFQESALSVRFHCHAKLVPAFGTAFTLQISYFKIPFKCFLGLDVSLFFIVIQRPNQRRRIIMNTFLTQTRSRSEKRPFGPLALLFLLLAVPGFAQEAQIDPQITSNGGEIQEGSFGELISTIGEPLAADSMAVSASSDEATWIGFWNIIPSDTTAGVHEEWTSGGSGDNGITVAAPNPFGEEITVYVRLENRADVLLSVYDMLGREVQPLIDGTREAGTTRVRWRPEQLPTGTYILRLEIEGTEFPARTIQYVR